MKRKNKKNDRVVSRMTAQEKEVNINYTSDNKMATLYASDTICMRKMDKLVEEYPDVYKCKEVCYYSDGVICGKIYEFPKKMVICKKPRKPMSQERKDAASVRLKRYHEQKNDQDK